MTMTSAITDESASILTREEKYLGEPTEADSQNIARHLAAQGKRADAEAMAVHLTGKGKGVTAEL